MLPIWSAAIDPHVLAVRAAAAHGGAAYTFDAGSSGVRTLLGHDCEHLLVIHGGAPVRLDVIAGTMMAGPVVLRFEVPHDDRLPAQLAAVRSFADLPSADRRHLQLAQRLLALHAVDARQTGASLKDTADLVLGPGDWPGAGEHRKSLTRRLIAAGEQMVRAGPSDILDKKHPTSHRRHR